MFLLCVGSDLDPKEIGFQQNMLELENQPYFTVFGGESNLPYANTQLAHDEQLFAFYSAAKKGNNYPLVEKFKESQLYTQAQEREDKLYQKFCSLYASISIESKLKEQVYSIYKEELSTFEI